MPSGAVLGVELAVVEPVELPEVELVEVPEDLMAGSRSFCPGKIRLSHLLFAIRRLSRDIPSLLAIKYIESPLFTV